MNKILVAVFDSEKTAYEGVAALKDLHRDGDISLYASSVIAKDAAGTVAVRQAADSGPLGTLVGIVGGTGSPTGVTEQIATRRLARVCRDVVERGHRAVAMWRRASDDGVVRNGRQVDAAGPRVVEGSRARVGGGIACGSCVHMRIPREVRNRTEDSPGRRAQRRAGRTSGARLRWEGS